MMLSRCTNNNRFEILSDKAVITRLGQGVSQSGMLSPQSIDRTLSVLSECALFARSQGAAIVAVGTSALRDARNRDAFLKPAQEILGTSVEIISGTREAALAFRGALHGLTLSMEEVSVIDVGGGSTEIIQREPNGELRLLSLDMGAVRITENHRISAPASPEQISDCILDIDTILRGIQLSTLGSLIAIGGTATTLASILESVEPYDPQRIHGKQYQSEEIEDLFIRLSQMKGTDLDGVKGLEKKRAEVIVGGALIIARFLKHIQCREITISDGGVRTGLAMEAHEVWD